MNEETLARVGPQHQEKNNVEAETAYNLAFWNRSDKSIVTCLLACDVVVEC